jgi:hypothetical protein
MFDGQTVESFIFRGEPQNLMVEVCRSPTNQMFNRYPAVDNRMLGPFTWHMKNGGEGKLKMPRMDTNGICMHLAGFLKSARTKNRSTMTILVPTEQFVSFDPALNF